MVYSLCDDEGSVVGRIWIIVEVAEGRRSVISASGSTATGARYCCRMVTDETGKQNRMCWPQVGLSTGSDG